MKTTFRMFCLAAADSEVISHKGISGRIQEIRAVADPKLDTEAAHEGSTIVKIQRL